MSSAKPGRKRRSLASLTAALNRARTQTTRKARAHYDLGLFHDNNGREAQAIPHYRNHEALALDIDPAVVPEALAWLASSLHKTGHPTEASLRAGQALRLTTDSSLRGFLLRLLGRIDRAGNAAKPH